jgi:hypothetical protein
VKEAAMKKVSILLMTLGVLAEAAGRGIKKGGEATVKGVETAGKWVGRKLHAGDEKSEKASESK